MKRQASSNVVCNTQPLDPAFPLASLKCYVAVVKRACRFTTCAQNDNNAVIIHGGPESFAFGDF